jgi:hypothetical protein
MDKAHNNILLMQLPFLPGNDYYQGHVALHGCDRYNAD